MLIIFNVECFPLKNIIHNFGALRKPHKVIRVNNGLINVLVKDCVHLYMIRLLYKNILRTNVPKHNPIAKHTE